MRKFLISFMSLVLTVSMFTAVLVSCKSDNGNETEDTGTTEATTTAPYVITEPKPTPAKNLTYEEGQIFPTFKAPSDKLIVIPQDIMNSDEMITMTCLQGILNAVETRVVILDSDVKNWLAAYKYKYQEITATEKYTYLKEWVKEVSGAVLYNTKLNAEYANLACTAANVKGAIPITPALYKVWTKRGIELNVVEDLTTLEYKSTVDIYTYMYDNYWELCDKRLVVVQRTGLFQMRDLASACGSAVIYLSCSGGKETELFKKFLNKMTPGESILIGWYADQERDLMTVAAQCGLSCVPADFFSNPTVFSQDIDIQISAVPDMPELENKIYIAFYFSDGDNIQYNMHAMREYWNNNNGYKGKVAVNWTISPALVDIAPAMMNYYYTSATDGDCFVCGPSGMGYTMPINTWGSNTGTNFTSMNKFTAYITMTNDYLQKSGLRTVTIWDNLTAKQRDIYSQIGTYLYGITVQNFTNASLNLKYTGVVNNLLINQMTPGYFATNAEGTTPLTDIEPDIKNAVKYLNYNGTAPVFISTQVSVWGFHSVSAVANLEQHLSDYYEDIYGKDVVEFVRSDHYFNLYYQANNLPFNLTLKSSLKATATSNSDGAALTTDGTPSGDSIWTASEKGAQTVTYELGASYELSEVILYNAGSNNLDKTLNTKAFKVEVSSNGTDWTTAATVTDNTANWLDVPFQEAVTGSYLRIVISDPGSDGICRIADIDIYGAVIK